jgi:RimJ/RimL family protein N-acetyltransferase
MTLEFFDFCLAGDREAAEHLAGVSIADDWLAESGYVKMRREQLAADPSYGPWCVRMIVSKSANRMIGQIGFHTPPSPPGLREIAPGGIEFGYRVYESHRRQGFAMEAAIGLMRWAATEQGIASFVVSIAPHNVASQAIATSLGFVKVCEQMDEVDGLEDVLVLNSDALGKFISSSGDFA